MNIKNKERSAKGQRSHVAVAVFSAITLGAGIATGASAQVVDPNAGNPNQTPAVLEQASNHDWHTGDAKKHVFGGNPVTMEHPGGDPDFLIDGDTIYVYTSTDANQAVYQSQQDVWENGVNKDTYIDMDGYTVWSSQDMVHWTNHGVQFSSLNIDSNKWSAASDTTLRVDPDTTLHDDVPRAMWAPTAAKYSNGEETTYVLYYPKGIDGVGSFATGYATAPTPVGPFIDQGPLYGDIGDQRVMMGMDPNVFQDIDEETGDVEATYIYANGPNDPANPDGPGVVVYATLSDFDHLNNTQTITSVPVPINYDANNTLFDQLAGDRTPASDFHEGGSMHKANGKYYLSWAEHDHTHYNGWYSMCDTPVGPCEWMGPTVKGVYYGNQHGSFVNFKGSEYFLSHKDHAGDVKLQYGGNKDKADTDPTKTAANGWHSYRRTWTFYPVTYNADKSLRVMYPDAAAGTTVPNINVGGAYFDERGVSYVDSVGIEDGAYFSVSPDNMQAFRDANPTLTDETGLELYKGQRVVFDGDLDVNVPLDNGEYNVTLKFAELYAEADPATFERVMNITAQNIEVVSELNVLRETNGVIFAAHDETFPVTVTNGILDIKIAATRDMPMLNAVQITKNPDWAINIGGGSLEVDRVVYAADPGVGAMDDNTQASIELNPKAVFGAVPEELPLFQTSQVGWAGLNYSNASLGNGNYEVTLGFVETYHEENGRREFDVAIEGIVKLDNFDIHKAAGGINKAVKRIFHTTVTDGALNIDLTTEKDASKISFIKVTKLPDDLLDSSIRINAGSVDGVTETLGADFLSDAQFVVGDSAISSYNNPTTRLDEVFEYGESKIVIQKTPGLQVTQFPKMMVAGTPTDEDIYQSERYGQNFGYEIPVRDGRYRIRFMFAEQYHSAVGMRTFTVSVEGQDRAFTGTDPLVDIFQVTGGKSRALDYFLDVYVNDGMLDIDFAADIDNASITGLVITPSYLKDNVELLESDPTQFKNEQDQRDYFPNAL